MNSVLITDQKSTLLQGISRQLTLRCWRGNILRDLIVTFCHFFVEIESLNLRDFIGQKKKQLKMKRSQNKQIVVQGWIDLGASQWTAVMKD